MLKAMRSKTTGYLAKLLMIPLVISFAIWGIGDIFRSDFGTVVARVGKEPIPLIELQRQARLFARAAEAAGIKNPDPRLLQRQMLRRMIEEKLTKLTIHDIGLAVGGALLAKELRQAPTLLNPDGTFDPTRFAYMLQQRHITEEGFLAQLRTDIEQQTLMESASVEELTLPANYMALSARAAHQVRDAVVVTIPATSAKGEIPGDTEIEGYYQLQKELLYMQPERRTLEYATIAPSDIQSLVDKQKDISPEEARDRVMQEVTSIIEDALAAGKDMRSALTEAGLHGNPRILVNVLADGGSDDFTKAVVAEGFRLGEGETSNLEVAKGGTYYLVTVKTLTPAAPKKLDEVKQDVTKRLIEESKRDEVTVKAQEAAAALSKNSDWRTVLAEQKLSGRPTQGITRNGGFLPAPLREAIFDHTPGEIAGPMTLPNGDKMLAIVTDVHTGTQTTLDEKAKKQLLDDLQQEIYAQYFNALAQRHPVTVNDAVFAKSEKAEATQ